MAISYARKLQNYGGADKASAYLKTYVDAVQNGGVRQQAALLESLGLIPVGTSKTAIRAPQKALMDAAFARLDASPELSNSLYQKLNLATPELRNAFAGKMTTPASGTTPASRAAAYAAGDLTLGYKDPELAAIAPAQHTDVPVGSSINAQGVMIPGVGTLKTIPKTPEQQNGQPDQNVAGLLARQGVETPGLTYTPPQATNGNNAYYKDSNNNVFRVSDNKPVKMGDPDPTLDWNKLGLNVNHLNTLAQIRSASGQGGQGGNSVGANGGASLPTYGLGGNPAAGTPGGTIMNAYDQISKQLDDLGKALAASQNPTPEELKLQRDLANARSALSKFDTETLKRAEAYSGQGRGATTDFVAGNVAKDARTRALERLGMAQDAANLTDLLSLTQQQREQQGAIAQTQFNIASKRLDVALGVAAQMDKLSDKAKDDARAYLLDVVDFAQGKEYTELDAATQSAIRDAVANSPITLDMVKNALHNGKNALIKKNTGTDDTDKKIQAFKNDLADWDMKGTREQFITRLQFLHPDVDAGDIQTAVYQYYPDGYDKGTDAFASTKNLIQQYKDNNFTRDDIEKQYEDAGKPVPLEVKKALDDVYGTQ